MKLIDRLSNTPADKLSWEICIQVLTDPLKVPYAGKKGNYVDEAKALAKFVLGIDVEGGVFNLGATSLADCSYEEGAFTLPAGSHLTIYSTGGDVKVADWASLADRLKGNYDFLASSDQVERYDAYFHFDKVSVHVEAIFKFYK